MDVLICNLRQGIAATEIEGVGAPSPLSGACLCLAIPPWGAIDEPGHGMLLCIRRMSAPGCTGACAV